MKYNFTWKVNMVDGHYHLVNTDEGDLLKFTESLLPRNNKETISVFDISEEYHVDGNKYNAIVIVGSKVTSIEYWHK